MVSILCGVFATALNNSEIPIVDDCLKYDSSGWPKIQLRNVSAP